MNQPTKQGRRQQQFSFKRSHKEMSREKKSKNTADIHNTSPSALSDSILVEGSLGTTWLLCISE